MSNITVDVNKIELPVIFELMNYFDDDRFKKVKIWIAHTGENLNTSVFSKDALSKLSETLPYTPIVGYIKETEDGDDFKGHEHKIVVKDNDIFIEYIGVALGFISDTPEVNFELRDGKEWLTCTGYLWTKFKKTIDIFDKTNGKKSHSMEIDNINGFVDEQGRLNVTDARFSALCVLGEDVSPGMKGSTVEFFSSDGIKEELRNMIAEFSKKGDVVLEKHDKDFEEVVEEKNEVESNPENVESVDNDEESELETEEFDSVTDVSEDLEIEDKTETETEEVESDKVEETEEQSETKTETVEEPQNYTMEFSFSFEDIRAKLHYELRQKFSMGWIWIIKTFDDYCIYEVEYYDTQEDELVNKFYKTNYKIQDEKIEILETEEVFSMFLNSKEKEEIESNRNKVLELEQELSELKEFKLISEREDKKQLIESYSNKISEEFKNNLLEKIDEFTKESIEKDIVFSIYKQTEDKDKAQKTAVFAYTESESEAVLKYGSEIGSYFN